MGITKGVRSQRGLASGVLFREQPLLVICAGLRAKACSRGRGAGVLE